jgi:hypothetical protein
MAPSFSASERTVLASLSASSQSAFTVPQVAVLSHMSPSEAHAAVHALTQKEFIVPIAPLEPVTTAGLLRLTNAGAVAVKELARKDETHAWIVGDAQSVAKLDDELDSLIDGLV